MAAKEIESLSFSLDPKSGVPYYKQVILQVEMAIADGRLVTGEQLPTVRSLAVDLKINPNTISRAYRELEIRGVVNTQQGTGTFISEKEIELSAVERERILASLTRDFIVKANSYGIDMDQVINYLQEMRENEPLKTKKRKD
ncbi:MAG: GntR family transcriptional regulator [Spirochaetales bacterium]|nr:GntR family transcriptional regulator [Spirochaetales bacterium]